MKFCNSLAPCIQRLRSAWAFGFEKPLDSVEVLSISVAYNSEPGVDCARSLAGGGGLFIRRRGMCNVSEYLTPINWLAWGKILANTRLFDVSKSKTASCLLFGIQTVLGVFWCSFWDGWGGTPGQAERRAPRALDRVQGSCCTRSDSRSVGARFPPCPRLVRLRVGT